MEQVKNKIRIRSLHPFQLISDGTNVYVQRGLVFDVDASEKFEVDGATDDLRYELSNNLFSEGEDIYVKIESDDPAEISSNESARILSASIVQGDAGPSGIRIGNITNGIIDQNIKSDIYVYIQGTSSA